MRILVTTTAIVQQGLGHIMRVTRFLEKVHEGKHEFCVLVDTDIDVYSLLIRHSDLHSFIHLNENPVVFAEQFVPDLIVFDRLDFNDDHFKILRNKFSSMISISPIFKFNCEMDLVVLREKNVQLPVSVRQLAGLEYTIFNHTVTKIQDEDFYKTLKSPYLNIGINMGGGDKDNNTAQILEALAKIDSPMFFWIVLGYAYQHSYDVLKDILTLINKFGHEFALIRSNENMWDIMRNCSLCILSGGLTAVESVYVGMPSINIYLTAEHQKVANKSIAELGATIDCGIQSREALKRVASKVREITNDRNQLVKMRQQCLSIGLADNGPENVLREIESLFKAVSVMRTYKRSW